MRYNQMRRESAAAMDAHAARFHAEVFLATPADNALPTTHPGMHQTNVADIDAFCIRPDGDNLADIFVAHRQRQLYPAILQLKLLPTADVVVAVPYVQVGVAYTGSDHAQYDLRARGRRRRALRALQWRAAFADIVAVHAILPGPAILARAAGRLSLMVTIASDHLHTCVRRDPAWRAPARSASTTHRAGPYRSRLSARISRGRSSRCG